MFVIFCSLSSTLYIFFKTKTKKNIICDIRVGFSKQSQEVKMIDYMNKRVVKSRPLNFC